MSQRVGGSLWREGSYRETCVGGSKITCLVARSGEKAVIGEACWWEKNHTVVEKAVIGRSVLVGATSQVAGRSI